MLEKTEGANENGLGYTKKNKRNRTTKNKMLSNTYPSKNTGVESSCSRMIRNALPCYSYLVNVICIIYWRQLRFPRFLVVFVLLNLLFSV